MKREVPEVRPEERTPLVESLLAILRQRLDHVQQLEPTVPQLRAEASDIREYVKKRQISGSRRSEAGHRCRDTFTSGKKTCPKLGVTFGNDLHARVGGRGPIPRRAELIYQAAADTQAPPVQAVLAEKEERRARRGTGDKARYLAPGAERTHR